MSGETLNRQYPFPSGSDSNDPPFWIQQLAEAIDADVQALANAVQIEQYTNVTMLSPWRAPTGTGPLTAPSLRRIGKRVYLDAGAVENNQTLSIGLNGLSPAATIPTGWRPTQRIAVPAVVNVANQFLTSGQVFVQPDGQVVVQTTNAWSNVPSGTGYFGFSTVSWVIP